MTACWRRDRQGDRQDPTHGWDHGVFIPLKVMFPQADIPVLAMSLKQGLDPEEHARIGAALQPLRSEGVLIMGSGNIVHNLALVDFPNFHKDDYGFDWAMEARATINHYLLDGNHQPLLDYKKQTKAFQLAIPTPEHYLPLVYTLGLQQKGEAIHLFNDKLLAGSLSMTSLKIS